MNEGLVKSAFAQMLELMKFAPRVKPLPKGHKVVEWHGKSECAFCGGPDKRHRVYDAIVDMVRGGDDPERIADDYGMSVESVLEIARVGYE